MSSNDETVRELLDEHGTTYAEQAHITLKDKPSALYRLLVLAILLAKPIDAKLAVNAAIELSRAGYRTPEHMRDADWQARVDALGRAHYRRYDEGTATRLGEGAQLLLDRYRGDLRRLRDAAEDTDGVLARLQEFPGVGKTCAAIFAREAQGVWPDLAPFFDAKALQGAEKAGLPASPDKLGELVDPADLPRLAAALVRVELS